MGKGRGATLLLWNWTQLSTAVLYTVAEGCHAMLGHLHIAVCARVQCREPINRASNAKMIRFAHLVILFIFAASTDAKVFVHIHIHIAQKPDAYTCIHCSSRSRQDSVYFSGQCSNGKKCSTNMKPYMIRNRLFPFITSVLNHLFCSYKLTYVFLGYFLTF